MIINRLNILNSGKHMTPESGFTPDGRYAEMPWELQGQVMLTSTFQAWVILTDKANPCVPQTGARLITCWDEETRRKTSLGTKGTSIVLKKFLYVYKGGLGPKSSQWLCKLTQAVIVVVFLHDKVFCQFLLRTPRFLLHSLSWISLSVLNLS